MDDSNIKTAKSTITTRDSVMSIPLIVKKFFGIRGIKNFLVVKTVAIEAEPKSKAALTLTSPFFEIVNGPY